MAMATSRRLAVVAAAILLVAVPGRPAHADCAAEPEVAIATQELVFVATALEQTDYHARVEVEEIWRGPDLAPRVWVRTSSADLPPWPRSLVVRAATSIDVALVPGSRYLIATENGTFRTNTCLVTEASDGLLERLAPEVTRQPIASGATGEGPGILEGTTGIVLAIAVLLALPVGAWFGYRRRSGSAGR